MDNGENLVAGYSNGKIYGWNLKRNSKIYDIDADHDSVYFISISFDKNLFAVSGKDGIIRIFSFNKIEDFLKNEEKLKVLPKKQKGKNRNGK